jgi:CMP-N,N'-diacetyllegionaminic acid synthase
MQKNNKILAIIPARSGSKGVEHKNIKELHGMPLIAHTIKNAKLSGIFDDIVVSTDSVEYATIAENYGARVPFIRPKELATDSSTSVDVIIHTIEELKQDGLEYDYFMLLQPTSPLRTHQDILSAINLLYKKNAISIVSVCEAEHSPLLMNTLENSLSMENFITNTHNKRRQDLPIYYRLNGAIYLCKTDYFLDQKSFYGSRSFAYIMNQLNSIDIDTEIDFSLVSSLLRRKNS